MSYNTLAEVQAVDAAITQEHLTDATIYLNARYTWPGVLADSTQAEDWPRLAADGSALTDSDGRALTGVPAAVKRAELEAAKLLAANQPLLPTEVATASSTSSNTGGKTHDEVKLGPLAIVEKYATASSESSTGASAAEIDSNGFAIIKKIDAILWPIINSNTPISTNNYRILRA